MSIGMETTLTQTYQSKIVCGQYRGNFLVLK